MAQLTLQQAFDLALHHHQSGRLKEAQQLYRQILARQPAHAGAMHYLGFMAHQQGRKSEAIDLIRRALALKPDDATAHYNLANVLKDSGKPDDAIAAYQQAIFFNPNFAEAYNNLGNLLRERGQVDEAIAIFHQAIALGSNRGRPYCNLGNALREKGQLDEAIAAYQQAISLEPDLPEAYSNLGDLLSEKGRVDEALAACRQAIALRPNFAEAYNNLGNVERGRGEFDRAIAAYQKAVALAPLDGKNHGNLGVALRSKGRLDDSIAVFHRAIELSPDMAQAYNNLGVALRDRGQIEEAIAAYRKAVALAPHFAEAHSNLIFTLHYHPGFDAAAIAAEHRHWNQQHAQPLAAEIRPPSAPSTNSGQAGSGQAYDNDRDPDRRLRIGYVSPDFRDHAVARFLLPLLSNHDHQSVEVFAYAQVRRPDAMTQRFRGYTDHWRNLVGLSDAQAADQIRQDQIDILVDLAGHTADYRLLTFARKPAPVQVTYLGYPDTTGLDTMDYRLTDAYADPPGLTEAYHSEKLIRLNPCAWCFGAPACPPLRMRSQNPITFGCFNTFAKVTGPMLELWSKILLAVPESRLLLKSAAMRSAIRREEIQKLFSELGVARDRLELRAHERDYIEHLALYGQMDIALDTFPYHGTTTTCEAMWMGVPVISLAGSSHVSRVGVSLLSNVGLPDLVAHSPQEYAPLAIDLANNLPRLKELHATLRQRMEQSPLMDAPRFAREVESAYRQVWCTWCGES